MPYTHEVNHIKLVGLQDRRRKLTDEQKTEIIRLRDEGWSLMKLAKEFEVSKKSILQTTIVFKRRTKMNSKTLMKRLLEAGYPPEDIDHHDYDLYVYVTPLTTRAIKAWMKYNDYTDNLYGFFIQKFRDQITGRMMYDILFQYIPSLDKKREH